MKLNKLYILSIFIILASSFVVTAEQLSEYEVTKIATTYVNEDELCEAFGPYEYNNNYYYVCSITKNGAMVSKIVIDANTGNIVTSENTAKYILKHDLALYYLYDEANYQLNIDNADVYRQNVNVYKNGYDFWISIRDIATTAEQKQNAQEAADISQNFVSECEKQVEVTEKIIEIQNRIKSGGTLEDAVDIIEAEEEAYYAEKDFLTIYDSAIERIPVIYDNILNANDLYGISEEEWKEYENGDLTFLKRERDVINSNIAYWESMDRDINRYTQWYYESMMDRIQESEQTESEQINDTPSFTFGLSVLVFLVIAMFLKD